MQKYNIVVNNIKSKILLIDLPIPKPFGIGTYELKAYLLWMVRNAYYITLLPYSRFTVGYNYFRILNDVLLSLSEVEVC
jgi:hypothetical protein